MNNLRAYHAFWSGFGLPAYDENSVPDDAKMPYITYEAVDGFFGDRRQASVSLWYRSQSWIEITEKEKEIADAIGRGGRYIDCDGGAVFIDRGQPWAQRMGDASDDSIRRVVLTIEVESIL